MGSDFTSVTPEAPGPSLSCPRGRGVPAELPSLGPTPRRMETPAEGDSGSQGGATACTATAGGSLTVCEDQRPPPALQEDRQREGLVELHTSFRELLTFFCTNATIHGAIRLVCSSQSRVRTASWGLLVAGALGVLYWQFGLLFAEYWRYPVVATVSVHSEPKLFPAVTLCDMNPHRPRSARHHLQVLDEFAQENIQSLYKFNFSKNRDVLSAADQLPQPAFYLDRGVRLQRLSRPGGQNKVGFRLCNSTGGDCLCRASTSAVTAAREWYCFHYVNVLALMPTAHEDSHRSDRGHFVLSCQFDGQDCQARHFRTFHHPTYGSCYTFDGVSAAQHQGVTRGISLVLRAEQRHHLPLLSTEAGARVMIHGHDHTPFLEHQGFSIRPGTETTIGIREDEVRRLGNPYSHCSEGADGVDVPLLYNASYTLQACLVSCFQQLMVETCSCGYFFYPLPSGAEYCSSARHPAWGHCFYRLSRDLGTHRLPCSSRCPRPCRESSYKLSAGTSRWPSSKSADWILAALGKHGHRSLGQTPGLRSSVAKVNIFYQELNYRRVDETPVYSVPQLLSAMGSLWSLWFGSSVLSVLELLELLLDALALMVLRGCRWLHTAQGSQLGAATGAPPTIPGTEQLPTDRRNINHLGGPAGLVPRNPSRSSGQSLLKS
ncbi:amiloride-sensitive sodium channel subunit delta isoform X1 [Mustela lutreola]|uniref:amiloride-sensitive sodium channel subunit delta isoform X1 n=2 Tax=Mustela lutreola TaxID=9666 RepID=UPI00279761A6|nr:amiloride-sensitive sodium channel subunit delta isoform X1 [Mustela lutreola]XP_058992231.1 amiloride-sensitive sodium channel subunit delta isoform X1 [Mustela lutreola]XP_058992232.1 amiloride-sensitive sodium channel subunit delta isoform X1 [Mustela lutreola]